MARARLARHIDRDGATYGERDRSDLRVLAALILWGSDTFMREYSAFRAVEAMLSNVGDEASPELMFAFEQLLYAIRRDVGHPNKDLGRGDLLRVFINDIDRYLAPADASA